MDRLLNRIKVVLKVYSTYVFYFPGLILHEGAHAIAAIMTFSTITDYKLFPKIHFSIDDTSYRVVYGYVASLAEYKVAYILIGIAPIFLWMIPLIIANMQGWVDFNGMKINWELLLKIENLWFFWLLSQVTWAGFPSGQDFKVVAHGLFSVSAAVFILGGYFVFRLATEYELLNFIKAIV